MGVYMVSTKSFFKERSIDYAMAVDLDEDLKLFNNFWDAQKYLESRMKFYREFFADHESCTSTDDENFIMIFYNKYETVRYVVSLTKKEVY